MLGIEPRTGKVCPPCLSIFPPRAQASRPPLRGPCRAAGLDPFGAFREAKKQATGRRTAFQAPNKERGLGESDVSV